jgi:fermentation-respiration switch protein FrsA (DUF1100 family)
LSLPGLDSFIQSQAATAKPPLDTLLLGVSSSDLPSTSALHALPDIPILILQPADDPNHPKESGEEVYDAIVEGRQARAHKAEKSHHRSSSSGSSSLSSSAKPKSYKGVESRTAYNVEFHAAPEEGMEDKFRPIVKEWMGRVMGSSSKKSHVGVRDAGEEPDDEAEPDGEAGKEAGAEEEGEW